MPPKPSNNTPPAVPGKDAADNASQTQVSDDGLDTAFLMRYLPDYFKHCASLDETGEGVRGIQGVKGGKQKWVLDNVWDAYSAHIKASGSKLPPLADVRKV
jgi:hypothetical protein